MDKLKFKKFALKHPLLLKTYRNTIGKLKTGLYFGAQRKALQKNGFEIIQRITEQLEDCGAVCFVDFGTLLGIIRDKKLIEYDRDIDFGVYFNENFKPEDLDILMKEIGLKRYRSFYLKGKLEEVTYANGIIHIDFFRHTVSKNGAVTYAFYRNPNYDYPSTKHFTALEMNNAHIKEVKKIQIGGIVVSVPVNAEEYLESVYTKGWRIPDPNWSYLSNPGLREVKDNFGILHK